MDTNFFRLVCACTLNRAFGYEPQISSLIVRQFGVCGVFRLPEEQRDAILPPFSKYKGHLSDAELEKSRIELENLMRRGYQFICIEDPCYPEALLSTDDPPAGLYIRSASTPDEIFGCRPMVSVVGTRDISPYGREWCRRIVGAMSGSPVRPCVVSGMALGVDICAHLAALETGLPTIGVLPCGIDDVYPVSHRRYAENIVSSPGSALITDYPPGTAPLAVTFLRRNRIIAALSSSTILVESKAHGGGMITAGLASGYGRDVFAVPGRLDDVRSAGCNALIKSRTAEPVGALSTLCEDLGLGRFNRKRKDSLEEEIRRFYEGKSPASFTDSAVKIARIVKLNRGVVVEDICALVQMDYPEVSSICGALQNDGFISIDLMQRCSIETKIV